MATTIINPNTSENSGMGFLIGTIILIIFAVLFFVYVLPYLRGYGIGSGGVQVNIPKSVNVNIKQSK